MIPLCQCNLYVGVKCVGARMGMFLYEFLCLRRMGRGAFQCQAAKKHGAV